MSSVEERCIEKMLLEPAMQSIGQLKVLLPISVEACESSDIPNRMNDDSVDGNADHDGAEDDENVVGE